MLRLEQRVLLGPPEAQQETVVREITPLMAAQLHQVLLQGLEQAPERFTVQSLADLFMGDVGAKLELLEQCCDLGAEVRGLGALAFVQLWQAFEAVNAPFLAELGRQLGATAQVEAEQGTAPNPSPPTPSAAASAACSSEATATSTPTAGAGS